MEVVDVAETRLCADDSKTKLDSDGAGAEENVIIASYLLETTLPTTNIARISCITLTLLKHVQ